MDFTLSSDRTRLAFGGQVYTLEWTHQDWYHKVTARQNGVPLGQASNGGGTHWVGHHEGVTEDMDYYSPSPIAALIMAITQRKI